MSSDQKDELNRTSKCGHCKQTFRWRGAPYDPEPRSCGFLMCRAMQTWTTAEWRSQLRMGLARHAAGQEPSPLDDVAFRMFPKSAPTPPTRAESIAEAKAILTSPDPSLL